MRGSRKNGEVLDPVALHVYPIKWCKEAIELETFAIAEARPLVSWITFGDHEDSKRAELSEWGGRR